MGSESSMILLLRFLLVMEEILNNSPYLIVNEELFSCNLNEKLCGPNSFRKYI